MTTKDRDSGSIRYEPRGTRLSEYLAKVPARGSTADAVTDALREAILDGLIPASSWLREEDIASELLVSRTPVREAIRRLTTEGLAVRNPNQGTQVAPMRLEDILAVYAIRESLEGLAARLTAQQVNDELRHALSEVHQKYEEAARRDEIQVVFDLNLQFHRMIREAANNTYLDRFLTFVEHAIRRIGRSTFEIPGRMLASIAEHQQILDAIVSGDPDAAEASARSHLRIAREARLNAFLRANA